MHTIGVLAGSFDPITFGHVWLINEAARLVDELHVVVGSNSAKSHTFSTEARKDLIKQSIADKSVIISELPKAMLLVHYAQKVNATHLIRGLRSSQDFIYEQELAEVNRDIAPNLVTSYLSCPSDLVKIRSSTVKGLIGYEGWETLVSRYVPSPVLEALKYQHQQSIKKQKQ